MHIKTIAAALLLLPSTAYAGSGSINSGACVYNSAGYSHGSKIVVEGTRVVLTCDATNGWLSATLADDSLPAPKQVTYKHGRMQTPAQAPGNPTCVFAGQPYSDGAYVKVEGGSLRCHDDGAWH